MNAKQCESQVPCAQGVSSSEQEEEVQAFMSKVYSWLLGMVAKILCINIYGKRLVVMDTIAEY